jgi:putative transposase
MTTPNCPNYAGHRCPAAAISHAVWLYFRFPLSLRHVDELLATRGVSDPALVYRGLATSGTSMRSW